MARISLPHRLRFRRLVVLAAVVLMGVGGLALEHTAGGATTGTPSGAYGHGVTTTTHHVTTTTTRRTTTTTAHVTTTTSHVTTTTAKHGDPGDPGEHDRHCDDDHGRDNEQNKHCRAPSGGIGSHGDRDGDNDGD